MNSLPRVGIGARLALACTWLFLAATIATAQTPAAGTVEGRVPSAIGVKGSF